MYFHIKEVHYIDDFYFFLQFNPPSILTDCNRRVHRSHIDFSKKKGKRYEGKNGWERGRVSLLRCGGVPFNPTILFSYFSFRQQNWRLYTRTRRFLVRDHLDSYLV